MKTNIYHFLTGFLLFGVLVTNCKKDESNELIEDNGLSSDINDFISGDIFDVLDSLGMPINTGGSPADIEGSYLVSPEILIASSRPNDDIGKEYSDITLIFSDQNNEDLTLVTKTFQGSQEGAGVGSFIVGDGNDFSVFTKVKTVDETYNDSILATQIYSGTLTSEGIKDMYVAFVLLDDYGDPNNRYVEIGDSRVFYDEDGFSEKVDEEKSVNINIQDVPIIVEGLTQGIFNDKLH